MFKCDSFWQERARKWQVLQEMHDAKVKATLRNCGEWYVPGRQDVRAVSVTARLLVALQYQNWVILHTMSQADSICAASCWQSVAPDAAPDTCASGAIPAGVAAGIVGARAW